MKPLRSNPYFDLFQISESCYAAISNNPMTMSNAGFIDLGNILVVFDTFLAIDAAKELKIVIDEFKKDRIIVLNSHQHLDHYIGNSVFKDQAIFLASKFTKQEILNMKQEIPQGYQFQEEIQSLEEKLKQTESQEEIYNIKNSLILYKNLKHQELEFVTPDIIIEDEVIISGTKGDLKLYLTKKAHSNGEIVGFIEHEKIAYVGDLVFVDEHPYIGAGDPYNLIDELEKLYQSNYETFVPGHGPICGKDKILDQIEYIQVILKLIQNNLEHPERITISDMPLKFQNQNYLTFRWNIDALTNYLKQTN